MLLLPLPPPLHRRRAERRRDKSFAAAVGETIVAVEAEVVVEALVVDVLVVVAME